MTAQSVVVCGQLTELCDRGVHRSLDKFDKVVQQAFVGSLHETCDWVDQAQKVVYKRMRRLDMTTRRPSCEAV